MSSKLLCACGKEHGAAEPLVITITACPNKKHHSHKPTAQSTPKKPFTSHGSSATPGDHTQRKNDKAAGNASEEPSNHILVCEDEGVTIPSKSAKKPLIDNSTFCDLDGESSPSTADKGTTKGQSEKQKEKESSLKGRETNDTIFDPRRLFESEEDILENTTVSKKGSGVDNSKTTAEDRPSKIRWESERMDDKRSPGSGSSSRDKTNIFPSDMLMKLPILLPRYHGPGCAMEVDVMEKHDQNCRLVSTLIYIVGLA